MMGGLDGARRLLGQEQSKAQDWSGTLGRLARYFGNHLIIVVVVGLLIVYSTWAQVTIPGLFGQAVDCFIVVTPRSAETCTFTETPGPSIEGLGRLVLYMVLLFVSTAVVSGLMFYLMSWTGQHVLVRMRKQVFRRIHSLSLGYFTVHEAGDVMSRLTNDVDTIQQAMTFGLVQVAGGVLLIVWIVVVMLRESFAYALLSLAVVPLMLLATAQLSGRARQAFRRSRVEMGSVSAGLQESIAGVREVQAFSREDENIEAFRRTNAANREANIRAVRYTSALSPTLELLSFVAIAVVAGVGGVLAVRGQAWLGSAFTLGLVVAFIGYVQRLNMPLQQIAVLWTNLQSALAGAERIFSFLDEVPDVADRPSAAPMPPIVGTVRFEGVWAEYEPGRPVLQGIDLEAEPGQTIAIVGPTGAGKTTIVSLIPRFWDVSAGRVTIDGVDVRDVTQDSLRSQIGIVLQDTFLFSDTVLENIRYGRPQATRDEVLAAARLVQADGFIAALPDGYDTVLGERGGGLSQGQRQLLSIARAALADPRLLILDEATSSVDTRTERLIQHALDELMHTRTSFVIAHRLSTVRDADVVLVVEDGRIVERGTHDALLAHGGVYRELYMSQFEAGGGDELPSPGPELPRPLEVAGAVGGPVAPVPAPSPAVTPPGPPPAQDMPTPVPGIGRRALLATAAGTAIVSVGATLVLLAALNGGGLRFVRPGEGVPTVPAGAGASDGLMAPTASVTAAAASPSPGATATPLRTPRPTATLRITGR
jgi:ATP-binding cassette subfamily B protein